MNFDPFAPEKGFIIGSSLINGGARIPWERINPDDMKLCLAIGRRASAWLVDFAAQHPEKHIEPPHPLICAADVACTHLSFLLDLERFLSAPDLDFCGEYITIAKFLDRPRGIFPSSVILKFARRAQ